MALSLADPTEHFTDLRADFHDNRVSIERREREYVRQLEALGYHVILEPAA